MIFFGFIKYLFAVGDLFFAVVFYLTAKYMEPQWE